MNYFINEKFKLVNNYANIFSKDPRTKVASLLITKDYKTICFGINTFPPGILNTDKRWERHNKYKYVIHAEINCIIEGLKKMNNLENTILLTTKYPCHECLKIIIQSGIKIVYSYKPDMTDEKWKSSYLISQDMLKESNIKIILIKK